jgi:hypothetical protein
MSNFMSNFTADLQPTFPIDMSTYTEEEQRAIEETQRLQAATNQLFFELLGESIDQVDFPYSTMSIAQDSAMQLEEYSDDLESDSQQEASAILFEQIDKELKNTHHLVETGTKIVAATLDHVSKQQHFVNNPPSAISDDQAIVLIQSFDKFANQMQTATEKIYQKSFAILSSSFNLIGKAKEKAIYGLALTILSITIIKTMPTYLTCMASSVTLIFLIAKNKLP